MQSHFYGASASSENKSNPEDPRGRKANPHIVSFPRQFVLTAESIAEHCLGSKGLPYTALEFREKTFEDGHKVRAYRDREHFIQAEAATGDVDHMPCSIQDGDPKPSLEAWKKQALPLLSLPFKVFVFPSFHFGVHTLSPLSHPVTDIKAVNAIQRYVQEELVKSGVKGECDEKVKDAARFFFPGPNVKTPSDWVLENDAPVLDADEAIIAGMALLKGKKTVKGKRGRPRKTGAYEAELIEKAVTPGFRNDGCYSLARYYGGVTLTESEARARYDAVVIPQEDFPQEEVDRCFENGYADCQPGSMIPQSSGAVPERTAAQFREALSKAVAKIQEACKHSYRIFSTLGLTSDDKDDPRWKSNRICRLEFTTPERDRGYAVPLDSTAEFEAFVELQIDRYKDSDPAVWLKLMEKSRVYFKPSILSPAGLILRHANEAQFLDGRLLYMETEGNPGEVEPVFEKIKSGEFYTEVIPFKYRTKTPREGSGIWKFLTSWLPKRPGQGGRVSVELLLLADFYRSAIGAILGNEQALVFESQASYGKSTFVALQSAALKRSAVKKFPDSLLTGRSSRFAWLNCADCYVVYFMDPPVGRVLDNIQLKQVISSDSKSMEVKGGAAWEQETYYRTEIFTNDMPRLKDPTDDGVKRRLRLIKLWRKFTGERGLPSEELIEGFRQFVCACSRLPKLPDVVWQEYPALKDWLSESCESDLFNEVLEKDPNSRGFVKVSELKAVLRASGSPLTKMPSGDFEKLLHAAGFATPRWACGKVIPHCRFNTDSTEWKAYKGLYVDRSHVEDSDPEESDEEKAKWQAYFDKINPILKNLPIPFDLAPDDGRRKVSRIQERPLAQGTVPHKGKLANEPISEDCYGNGWTKEEFAYRSRETDPLLLQDRNFDVTENARADLGADIEEEDSVIVPAKKKRKAEIEPVCVKDIKPWKLLDLSGKCLDVPREVRRWIRDVGVEESGVAAVCAGKELAEKLPAGFVLEEVLKDAPVGEFEEVLKKSFYEQRK